MATRECLVLLWVTMCIAASSAADDPPAIDPFGRKAAAVRAIPA